MSILDEILDRKRREVEVLTALVSRAELASRAELCAESPRPFRAALASGEAPTIIAELKRRSPSAGEIRSDFDPERIARAYFEGGAAALSVLTDAHFFGGELEFLRVVRKAVSLPLLRKDFVIDRYQVDESRVAGADAILLIVAALAPERLAELHGRARELGLDVLVEVHDESELDSALAVGARLVGVNNRNLNTFEVDLAVTERLGNILGASSPVLLVSESGIRTEEDLRRLSGARVSAFLVGESLMREPDLTAALKRLRRSL